jgi:hypothetical protein
MAKVLNPKHIRFDIQKEKGFRGHKFIATTIIDDKGHQITEEPKEGSDIITLRAEQRLYNAKAVLTDHIANDLINALENNAKEYKPLYEI